MMGLAKFVIPAEAGIATKLSARVPLAAPASAGATITFEKGAARA